MDVIEPGGKLLVVTENGFGKCSRLEEYPTKGRATGGVTTIDQKSMPKIGQIADARVVQDDDDVTMISSGGIMLRLKVKVISMSGRSTRGFKVMDLKDSIVASVARMAAKDLERNDPAMQEKRASEEMVSEIVESEIEEIEPVEIEAEEIDTEEIETEEDDSEQE
jgi:DNA gyrase subunit A